MSKKRLPVCARCGRAYGELQIRRCPNEAVNRVLGEYICYYCCRRCQFHAKHALCGAIECHYSKIKEDV